MEIQGALLTVVSIFLLLLVGYGAKRTGVLRPGDAAVVNSIVINLTMPAFIFVYTHGRPLTAQMVKSPVIGFGVEMLMIGAAYVVGRALKLDRRTTGGLMLAAAFGNTGFLGYPVARAAFPDDGRAVLTAVMFDNFGMALALNTVGVAIAAAFAGSEFEWKSLFEFLKTPLFPATVVALMLRTVHIPQIIMDTLGYLAAGTVPLAMISIGLSLSTSSVKRYPAATAAAVVLKMVVLPAAMYFILPVLGITGVVQKVTVLESAMPSAVFTGVIAARYGANGSFVAGAVFVTTLLSVLVIPGVLALIG